MAEDGDILILLIKHKKVELVFEIAYCISLHYNTSIGDAEDT